MTQLKNVADVYPLSPMQALMLTHALAARAAGGSAGRDASFSQSVYDIRGDLDAGAFAEAWRELTRRHTALRTAVLHEGLKQPVQVVRNEAPLEFVVEDWRGQPDTQKRLDAWLAADRARGIDLTAAPLMRFALFRTADDAHRLVWTSHHIVVDRWCIGLLMNEARALYQAAVTGQPAQLPPARPFRDYIAWLQKRNGAADEAFWRAQLAGASAAPLASASGGAGGHATFRRVLEADMTAALRAWLEPARLTLNTVCTAAFALALAGADDRTVIGMTLAGRPADLPGVEGIAGCFINNVPLCVDLRRDGEHTAVDWLRQTQSQLLDVQEHGHVSPLKLDGWRGEGARGPVYQALYVYQAEVRLRADAGAPISGALDIRPVGGELNAAVPLVLAAGPEGDALALTLTYDRASISDADAVRWIDRMCAALRALAQFPRQTLRELRAALPAAPAATQRAGAARADAGLHDHVEARFHPANATEAALLNIWRRALGRPDLGVEDSMFDAGATSLQAMRMIAQIEQQFGKPFQVAALYQAPSARAFARLAAGDAAAAPAWRRLVPIQPSGARTPFFIVHHGAGSTYGFNGIARHLHPEQPLYGLQESGWARDEAFPDSVTGMAAEYVTELRSIQPHGPYVLGGFCFGGVVAFEMAQQLRAAGERVALLVLLDAYAPVPMPEQKPAAERMRGHAERMSALSPAQRAAYVLQRARRRVYWETTNARTRARNMAWTAINDVFPRMGLSVDSKVRGFAFLKWNAMLQDRYTARPYEGAALLIRSEQPDLPQDYGWNGLLTPGVRVHQMRTEDHLAMLLNEHAVEVARVIEDAAAEAVGAGR